MTEEFDLDVERSKFISVLRTSQKRLPTYQIALETIKFLRKVVVLGKYENVESLLSLIAEEGRLLSAVEPSEFSIKNTFLMVLKLVREENTRIVVGRDDNISPYDSLNKLWKDSGAVGAANIKKLRKCLIQTIKEVALEMETCRESITAFSADIIQPHDVVMVYGLKGSATLMSFLNGARKNRNFRVVSVSQSKDFENSPDFVNPIHIYDVGSQMCDIKKVVLPAIAIFPDGSCLVPAGSLSICLSAQRHSVPIYVLAGFYKITPYFVPDHSFIIPHGAPGVPFSSARKLAGKVEILQPAFDVVPSSLITCYVFNSATVRPSHVYRLIGDYYHPEDVSDF